MEDEREEESGDEERVGGERGSGEEGGREREREVEKSVNQLFGNPRFPCIRIPTTKHIIIKCDLPVSACIPN